MISNLVFCWVFHPYSIYFDYTYVIQYRSRKAVHSGSQVTFKFCLDVKFILL